MKKRLGFLMLAIIFALTSFGSVVLADNEKVEVEFCVGDDTLMINGETVVVEKPYVVGAGVTLVPLRVITEAFGALVEWIGETKTINLTYPDVNIVLQIDNPVAEINGRAETLLAAPELTQNGYTMVPLRFISENFGATVSYDEATQRITVTKESSAPAGTTVEGGIDNKYIGDSYYNWHMENPKDMAISERRFDGRQTVFVYDDNNSIDISISNIEEDYDFEKDFAEIKSSTQGYTLVKADKDSEKKTMHFHVKDKNTFFDTYVLVSDKYIYDVSGIFDNENDELREEYTRIIQTFSLGYKSDDIYDLSNVKDGMRKFENESMNFTLDIPTDYIMVSDPDALNEFDFVSSQEDDVSGISMGIYSKGSFGGAEALASYDMSRNKKDINEKIATFSDTLKRTSYKNIYNTTYEYEYEINGTYEQSYTRDVFFEIGDYVYNIAMTVKLPGDTKIVDTVLNSLDAEEIDSSKVGNIIYNMEEIEGTFTSDVLNKCTFEVPNDYLSLQSSSTAVVYMGPSIIFGGSILSSNEKYDFRDAENLGEQYIINQSNMEGKSHVDTSRDLIGEKTYIIITIKTDDKNNESVTYAESYITAHDNKLYIFDVLYTETFYSEHLREEIRGILKSAVYE